MQDTHRPDKRYNKPINYNEEYDKFYAKIKKYDMNNIISIDETSINVGLNIKNGRSLIGKRLYRTTKDNIVFVKYTLIVAISTTGIENWILYKKGGIDHERLIEFLSTITTKYNNKLILMDNASSHRNPSVQQYIKDSNNDYIYVLPYHHYQNPIEKFFNQFKYYIKKDEPMSYDDIKTSINKAITKISKQNLLNYFKSSLINNKDKIDIVKNRYHKKPKIYKP